MKPPMIIIAGPTGVGKTSISIGLAQKLNGEIISADSMQVYKGLDIGTAKIKKEEMCGIPHHLIDIAEPTEDFDVKRFSEEFEKAAKEILSKNKPIILVGGTGFYIQAALYGVDFSEDSTDSDYRKKLEEMLRDGKSDLLYKELSRKDPASLKYIHPNNHVKIIRALEYYKATGKPISSHNEEVRKNKEMRFDALYYVLTCDRKTLYERIDKRVDKMIENGLIDEIKGLLSNGVTPEMSSMKGIGYHEFIPIPKTDDEIKHAVEKTKLDSRHYAKRQLTWFRHEKDAAFLDLDESGSNLACQQYIINKYLEKFGENHD